MPWGPLLYDIRVGSRMKIGYWLLSLYPQNHIEGNTIVWGKRCSIFWMPTRRKLWFSKGEKLLPFQEAASACLFQWAPKLVKVMADGPIKAMTCQGSIVIPT